MEIRERILKDIRTFDENIAKLDRKRLDGRQLKVVELSEMYARDARSWLEKGDYYTSFSSVAYAHGLLDAILKINSKEE